MTESAENDTIIAIDRKAGKKHSEALESWRIFRSNKLAVFGLIVVCFLLIAAYVGPLFFPMDAALKMVAAERLSPPGAQHWFGTDGMGRDIFHRIINGARVSLTMGFLPTIISLLAGMLLGAITAYYGGWIDNLIMRFCDVMACIPGLLMALVLVAVLGTGLTNMLIAITITSIPGRIRFIRSVVLNLVELEYIEAARACGTGPLGIMWKHILPNAFGPIVLNAMGSIAGMIMMGAGMSFLGLGLQPPYPEWGAMLNDARDYLLDAPWLFYIPGAAIMLSVFSVNMIGDGMRDALDPKLKR